MIIGRLGWVVPSCLNTTLITRLSVQHTCVDFCLSLKPTAGGLGHGVLLQLLGTEGACSRSLKRIFDSDESSKTWLFCPCGSYQYTTSGSWINILLQNQASTIRMNLDPHISGPKEESVYDISAARWFDATE